MTSPVIDHWTSDQHYGHANIIDFVERPFKDLDDMADGLVSRYNEVVSPTQTVCWVGDAFFGAEERAHEILSRLNGDKILVRGNHDGTIGRCLRLGFSLVVDDLFLKIGGRRVRVNHYPPAYKGKSKYPISHVKFRPKLVKDEWLIHGHTHSKDRIRNNLIHVGVDAWDYRPVSMRQIEELINPPQTTPLFERDNGEEQNKHP